MYREGVSSRWVDEREDTMPLCRVYVHPLPTAKGRTIDLDYRVTSTAIFCTAGARVQSVAEVGQFLFG